MGLDARGVGLSTLSSRLRPPFETSSGIGGLSANCDDVTEFGVALGLINGEVLPP